MSELRLRPARLEDAEALLAWRNDPATRAASFQPHEISLAEHRAWLARRLADPDCLLLVVRDAGRDAGSVRLEREDAGTAEVHVALAPDARGRGLGPRALRAACQRAAEGLGVTTVRARVKAGNAPSLRAFEAAGFSVTGERDGVVELSRPAA